MHLHYLLTRFVTRSNDIRSLSERIVVALFVAALVIASGGCKAIETNSVEERIVPSNFRDWDPNLSILPSAEFEGNEVTVHKIRNCSYVTESDYVLSHYDKTFNLADLESVDYIVVPFKGAEVLAHTMISFGFGDGQYLTVSAEVRTEKGESFSPVLGLSRQFEITYVVADERDVIRLRTRHRDADVYIYRTTSTPEKSRELFIDVMNRVNKLKNYPEFYDTILNNCVTNIVNHVNRISPNSVPYGLQVLMPGFSDVYAYQLGLIDNSLPFDEVKRRAHVNALAEIHYDAPDFSDKIRKNRAENIEVQTPSFDDPITVEFAEQPTETLSR